MGPTDICNCSCRSHFVNVFWRWCTRKPPVTLHTRKRWSRSAFWDCWKTDVKLYCACCRACIELHRGRVPKQAGLKPLFAGTPMEVLHVDLTGPHVTSQGYRHSLWFVHSLCDCRFFTRRNSFQCGSSSGARGSAQVRNSYLGGEFQNELWHKMS